jgi:hypothetical protein
MLLDRKSLGWLFQKPDAISKQDFISMLDVQKLSTQEEAVRLAGSLFAKKLKLSVSDIEVTQSGSSLQERSCLCLERLRDRFSHLRRALLD